MTSTKAKQKGATRRASSSTKRNLHVVPPQPQSFKTQEELDVVLRRSISKAGKLNAEGVIEAPGICHGDKSGKALLFDTTSVEIRCLQGCDYKAILRAFKLPEQPEADKADALVQLREELEVPFKRIVKLGTTNSIIDAELDSGLCFSLGSASDVLNVGKVEAAIADATGIVIPGYTKAKWRPIARLFFAAAEVVKTFSETDETRSWVEAFISSSRIRGENQATMTEGIKQVALDDKEELFKILRTIQTMAHKPHGNGNKGFVGSDKSVYLYIETFMYFVNFNGLSRHRVSLPELAERLTRLKFGSRQIASRQGDEVVKVRLWVSPTGFLSTGKGR